VETRFVPAPSDVFVVGYPRCGTTWVSQIVHALRTGAEVEKTMAFGEISEVVPWDVQAEACGQRLNSPQVGVPRAFKSHETWEEIAKGARYIYVARDPVDAFLSCYEHLPAYANLLPGDLEPQQFADALFAGAARAGQIWPHFLGWWKQRRNPDVLWVFYDDLHADLPGCIARVAEFLGLAESEPATLERTAALCSFDFMSAADNAPHFDDHFVRGHVLPRMGLPRDLPARVSKVCHGVVGRGARELPAGVVERLAARWAETMVSETGCSSYSELREAYSHERPLTPDTAYAPDRPRFSSSWFSLPNSLSPASSGSH